MTSPKNTVPSAKKLELWFRRVSRKFLQSSDGILVSKPELSFKLPKNPKILLLRQDKIGDALISFPVIRLLRQHFPTAEIDILLGSANFTTKRALSGYIYNAWLFNKKISALIALIFLLRRRRYDVVIDLLDKASSTSAFLARFSGARNSIGFDHENREAYSHRVSALDRQTTHIVERTAQVLLPFGINPKTEDLSLEFPLSDELLQKAAHRLGAKTKKWRVGVNIAASSRERFWGIENFISFLCTTTIKFPQCEFVIFAPTEYAQEQTAICHSTESSPAPIAHSFDEFAALLYECDAIFTPDTSAVHLASAWKKPAVVLFVDSSRETHGIPWTPYNSPFIGVFTQEKNLSAISPDAVLDAFVKLLTEFGSEEKR